MKKLEYSYTVLKYRHDIVTGEVLNIGVVIYAPETGQKLFHVISNYARLSNAFEGFDDEQFRLLRSRFAIAVNKIRTRTKSDKIIYSDVSELVCAIWPDQGLGYFASPAKYGLANDLHEELIDLFNRFVPCHNQLCNEKHEKTTSRDNKHIFSGENS